MDIDREIPSTPLQQVCDALEYLTQGSARLRSAVHTASTATFRREWKSSLDPDAQQMFGYYNECNLHDWSTRTSNVQVRLALAELTLQQALDANAGNPKAASVLPRYQDLALAAQTDLDLRADLLQLIQELSLPDVSLGDTNSVALRIRRALVARNRRALALKHRADELTAALAAVEAAVVAESTSDALACRTYIARYLSEDAFRSSPAPSADGTALARTGAGPPTGSVSPTPPALIGGMPGPAAGHSPVIADGRGSEGPSASLWSPHDLYTSALLPTATDVLPLGAGTAGAAGVHIQITSRAGAFATGADPSALSLEHSSLPRHTDLACLLNGPLTTKGPKGHASGLQEDCSDGKETVGKPGTGGVGEYILVNVPLTVSLAKALASASEHLQARRMAEKNAALESATLAAGLGSSSLGLLPSAESSVQIERATVPAQRLRSSLAVDGSNHHEQTQDEDMAAVDSGSHGDSAHGGVSRVLVQIRKAAQGELEYTEPLSADAQRQAQAQGQGELLGLAANEESRSVSIAATEEVAAIEMSHGLTYLHTGRRPGEVVQVQQESKEGEAETATSDPFSAPAMALLKAKGCDLPRKAVFNNRAALLPTARIVGLRVTALQVNTAAAEEGWLRPQDVLLGVSLHGTDRRWGVSADNLQDAVLPTSAGQEKSALALDGWQNGKLAALLKSSLLVPHAGTGMDGQRGILGSICLARPAPLVLLEAAIRGRTAAEVLQRPWPVDEAHGLPAFVLSPPTDVKSAPGPIPASKVAADPLGVTASVPSLPSMHSPKRGRPPSSSFSGTYGSGMSSLASPQAPAGTTAGAAGSGVPVVGRARASSAAAVLGLPPSSSSAPDGTTFDSVDSVRGASAPPTGVPTRLILEPLSVDREHPALDRALCLTAADATTGFGMGVEEGSFHRAVRADGVYTGYRPSGVEKVDPSLSDWNMRRQGRGDGKAGGAEAGGAAGKAGRKAAAAAAAQSASAETVDSERKAARSSTKGERSGSASSSSGPVSSARGGGAAALLMTGGSAQDALMADEFDAYTADTNAGKVSIKNKRAAKSKSGKLSSGGGGAGGSERGSRGRGRALSTASGGSDMTIENNNAAAGGAGTGQQGESIDDAVQAVTGVSVRSKRKNSHKASVDVQRAGMGDDILIVNDTAVGAAVDAGASQSDVFPKGANGKKAGGKRKRVDAVPSSTDAEPSTSLSLPQANASDTAGAEVGMGAGESAAGDTADAASSSATAAKRGRKAGKASKSSVGNHSGTSPDRDQTAQSQASAAHSTSRSPSGRVNHDGGDSAAHSGSAARGQGSGARGGSGKPDSAGRVGGGKGGSSTSNSGTPGGQEAVEDTPAGPSVPPIVPPNPRIHMYRGQAPLLPSGLKDAIRAKRAAARLALLMAASGGAAANTSNTSTVAAGQSTTGSQPSTARSASSAGSSGKSSEAIVSANVMFPELGKLQPIAPITRDIMLAALRGEWRKHHTHATVTPCDRQLLFPADECAKLNTVVATPRIVGAKRASKQVHGQPADPAVRSLGDTAEAGGEDAETLPEVLSSPQQVRAIGGGEGVQGDGSSALGGVHVEYTPPKSNGSAAMEVPLSASTAATVQEGADASAASAGRRVGTGRGGSSMATKKAGGTALASNTGRPGTGAAPISSGVVGGADERGGEVDADEEYAWLDDEDSDDDESLEMTNTVDAEGRSSTGGVQAAVGPSAEGAGPYPASRSAARGGIDSAPGRAATEELPPLTCDLFRHMHQPITFHLNFKNVGAVPLRRILAAAGMPYDGDKLCLMERMRALLAAPVSPDVRPLPPLDFNKEASQGTPQKNAPRAWDWAVDTARKLGFGDTDTRVRHWLTCPLSPSDPPLHPVVASYRSYVSLPKDKQTALQSNGKGWVFSLPPPVTACEPYLLCKYYAYPDMVLAAPFLRTVNAVGHDLLLSMGFHAKNGAKLQQEHEMSVQAREKFWEELPIPVDGVGGPDSSLHASAAAASGAVGGGSTGAAGGPATDSAGIASASAIGRRRASQRSPPSGGVSFGPPSARSTHTSTGTSPPSAKGALMMSTAHAAAAAAPELAGTEAAAGGSSTVEEVEGAAVDAEEQSEGAASVPSKLATVSSASVVAATASKSGRGRKRPLSSGPSPSPLSAGVVQSGAPSTRLAAALAGTAKDDADIEIVDEESSGNDAAVAKAHTPGDPFLPPTAAVSAPEDGHTDEASNYVKPSSVLPSSTNKKARVQDAKDSSKDSVGSAVPVDPVNSLTIPSTVASTTTTVPHPTTSAGLPVTLPGLQLPMPDLGPLEGAAEIQLGEIGALGLDSPGTGLDLGLEPADLHAIGSAMQGQGRPPPLLAAVAETVGIEVVDISGLPSSHVRGGAGGLSSAVHGSESHFPFSSGGGEAEPQPHPPASLSAQGTASQGGNKGKGGIKGKGGRWVKTGGGGGGGSRSTPVGAFTGFATGPVATTTGTSTTSAAAAGAWNGKGKAGSSNSRTGTASGKGKGGSTVPYTTRGASSASLTPLPMGSPMPGLGGAGGAGPSVAPALALTLPMAPLDRPHGVRHALGVYSSLGIDDGVKVRYTPYARTAVDTLPCGWDEVDCWKEGEKEDRITKRLRVYDWAAESIAAQAAGTFPAAVLAAWPAVSPVPAASSPAGTPMVTVRPLIPSPTAPLPSPSPAASPAVDRYARPASHSAASGNAFPSVVSPVCAVDVLCSTLACVTSAQIDGETYVVAGQGADPVALMGRALLDIRMAHPSLLEPMYVFPLYCLALGTSPGAGILGDRPSQRALGKSSLFEDAAGGSSFLQPRSLPMESDHHDDCLISIGSEPGLAPDAVLRRIVSAAAAEIRRFAPQSDYGALKLQRIALMANAALRTSTPGVSSCFLSSAAYALSQVTYGTFAPSEPKRGPVFTAAGPLLQHGHGTRGSKHGFYGPSATALMAGSVSGGAGGASGAPGLPSERGDRAIETRGGGFAPEHRANMPAALPRDAPMVPLVGVESADCVPTVAPGSSARPGEFTTEVDAYAARALTAMLHAVGASMVSITARPGAAGSGLFGSSSRAGGVSGHRVRTGDGSGAALGMGGPAMVTASSLGSSSTALALSTGPSSPVPGVVPTLVVQTLTQRCSYDVWGRVAARSKTVHAYLTAGTPFIRERADANNSEGMTELEAAMAEASLGESDGHRLVGAVELVRRMQVQAVCLPLLQPRAGHEQSSGSAQTGMHAAYSFLGKLYRPVPPSKGELLLRSWTSTLCALHGNQAQAAAAVPQHYQRARDSLRRVQEAVAAESCRRRLCALIVECTARGLYAVASVLAGWIPAGMLPHDKPAVAEAGGKVHTDGGDAPTTWVPVSSWPWPYPVAPCATGETRDNGDDDTAQEVRYRVDTAAAEAAFYGRVDTPAGRREKQMLESLGFVDPALASAPVDPLAGEQGKDSTMNPMDTATQPPGAWFVGQTPNVPLTAQTQDPASRTAAHGLFLSLQRYAVEGRLITPLGQRLLHPLAVVNFVTLQAQM